MTSSLKFAKLHPPPVWLLKVRVDGLAELLDGIDNLTSAFSRQLNLFGSLRYLIGLVVGQRFPKSPRSHEVDDLARGRLDAKSTAVILHRYALAKDI